MNIKIYGKENCEWCDKAKELLDAANVEYEYIDIKEPGAKSYVTNVLGAKTVPAILIDDIYIGGYNDLVEVVKHGPFNGQAVVPTP